MKLNKTIFSSEETNPKNSNKVLLLSQDGSRILTLAEEIICPSSALEYLPLSSDTKTGERFIRIWDAVTAKIIKEVRLNLNEKFRPLSFAGNDKIIIDNSGILQIWNFEEETLLQELKTYSSDPYVFFFCYDFNPSNNKALIYPSSKRPFLWNCESNEIEVFNFPFSFGVIHSKSTDGSAYVFLVEARTPSDYQIVDGQDQGAAPAVVVVERNSSKLVKEAGERLQITYDYYKHPSASAVFLREKEKKVVVGYSSGLLREYDLLTGEITTTYQKKGKHILEVFEDINGRLISIGDTESHLTLWDKNGKKAEKIEISFVWDEEAEEEERNYPSYNYPSDGRFLVYLSKKMRKLHVLDFRDDTTSEIELPFEEYNASVSSIELKDTTVYLIATDGSLLTVEIQLEP